jgi:CheY-like chemotaxis protein
MNLSSLLICADEASVEVLQRVLAELGIRVECCANPEHGFLRLAQSHFDLLIFDCETKADVMAMLRDSRASRQNDATLTIAIVTGQERIREMFALGVNFVLYKPVAYERAMSSLRAAQNVLFRDKRRKARAPVHAHAVIDYAGVEQARATLVDLAEDGLGLNFTKKLPPTCKVYFQFQLPGQLASVRLSGQVVWQDWNGRAGLEFVDVPQASRKILRQWLTMNLANEAKAAETEVVTMKLPTPEAGSGLTHTGGKKEDLRNVAAGKEAVGKETPARHGEAVARLRAEPGNRRGKTRYACRLGAEVFQRGSTVRNFCHLSDLSAGGCYLEMPIAFAESSLVELVVRTEDMKLKLSGVVKSSHPGYGMGISFHVSTKEERSGVQQLIDFVAAAAESAG